MDNEETVTPGEELVATQVRAPKREIEELCANTMTDTRSVAIMIAVRTYNKQKAAERAASGEVRS